MKKIHSLAILGALIATGTSTPAWSSFELLDPRSGDALSDSPFDAKEGFAETGIGAKVYGLILTLKTENPDPKQNPTFSIEGGEVFDLPGGKKGYVIGASEATVMNASKSPVVKVKWTPEQSGIVYDGCQRNIFQASMGKSRGSTETAVGPAPFPIAISCNLESSPAVVMVSVPSQIQWDQTTLQEISGKGQRWRLYQLPSAGTSNTQIGKLVFRSDKRLWTVGLNLNKLSEQASRALLPSTEKQISIGYTMAKLGGDAGNFSSSDFVFRFEGLSEPLLGRMKLGLLVNMNFGLSSDPNLIFGKDIGVNFGYYFGLLSQGDRAPFSGGLFAELRSTDFKHAPSSFSVQATYFDFGLESRWRLSPKHRLSLTGRFGNFGSAVLKSQMGVQLGYSYIGKLFGRPLAWGPSFLLQNLSVTEASGAKRTLGSNLFLLTFEF
ncbi:MAG: hypothetical protein KGQ59_09370 [Bdellovibrionales bacterium]|nr:hypothetical protein [Bdellovibrionales bacterium]